MSFRKERDTLGEVSVPEAMYYGAQTQRSLQNFSLGKEAMPEELIYALAMIKKAAAMANGELGLLDEEKRRVICDVVDEILRKELDPHFPLRVWQTGSGTQTNMNMNEVISNRGNELLGGERGSKHPIHPNDDVNLSQSSNDVFPAAMHVAAMNEIEERLLPALKRLHTVLENKAHAFSKYIKVGRTHLMDAVPISLGQEFSGYASQIEHGMRALRNTLPHLSEIALGGTAVGTGLNAPPRFASLVAKILSELTGHSFVSAPNKFEAIASSDTLVEVSGALKRIAVSLFKMANDVRWMGSGPRCGLGEIALPANEPGSSIMPGKVNPTQCEALTMIAAQVMGNDAGIGFAASQGNFELNVFRPMLIYNLLQSIRLLADGVSAFAALCVAGLEPMEEKMRENLSRSLMNATVLNTRLGYDAVAKIVRKAYEEDLSVKEATLSLGLLSAEEFDALMKPEEMI